MQLRQRAEHARTQRRSQGNAHAEAPASERKAHVHAEAHRGGAKAEQRTCARTHTLSRTHVGVVGSLAGHCGGGPRAQACAGGTYAVGAARMQEAKESVEKVKAQEAGSIDKTVIQEVQVVCSYDRRKLVSMVLALLPGTHLQLILCFKKKRKQARSIRKQHLLLVVTQILRATRSKK